MARIGSCGESSSSNSEAEVALLLGVGNSCSGSEVSGACSSLGVAVMAYSGASGSGVEMMARGKDGGLAGVEGLVVCGVGGDD